MPSLTASMMSTDDANIQLARFLSGSCAFCDVARSHSTAGGPSQTSAASFIVRRILLIRVRALEYQSCTFLCKTSAFAS